MYGVRGGTVFQTLRYKSKGRGLNSRWGHEDFSLTYFFSATPCPWGRCMGLTTLPLSCVDYLEILGVSTSWGPMGLSRSVLGELFLLTVICQQYLRYNLQISV